MAHNPERSAALAAMEKFRREWRGGEWKKAKLPDLIEQLAWFEDLVVKHPHKWRDDIQIAEEMRAIIETAHERLVKSGMAENPIAFFQPSWTQAQILNAWHPQFEPDKAPNGYRTCIDISAVRVGKTTATCINKISWLIPNDPDWMMFKPYVDFKGRRVEVFRRPNWDYWNKTGKMVYAPEEPPKSACECWHGCPDEMHWKEKLEREYRKWMPWSAIGKRGKDDLWNTTERWFETKWGSRVNGKLYGSDMQAWSGKELFIVTLDEGPPKDKLEEARIRTSYIWWAFTPREAANTGDRTRIAHDVYCGKYKLLPPMRTFQFSWDDVPEHIMPAERKRIREAMLDGSNAADRVTREGGFFFSSPNVFDAFNRNKHVLPITGELVMRAIRGEATGAEMIRYQWLERFRDANIIRGFDEGTAHPTACAWCAILKTGEKVVFREFCEAAHSITERAKRIIELSGNKRVLVRQTVALSDEDIELARTYGGEMLRDKAREEATGAKLPRYREQFEGMRIRKTLADSKIFRRDPNHPLDDWTQNYARAGLKMERASNATPNARCDYTNTLFQPDHTRQHLNPSQDDPENPHGYQLYLTNDCAKTIGRLETYLWAQIQSGSRVGEFTGKPETSDDDIIDALCYVAIDRSRWIDMSQVRRAGDLVPA